mgnify:CR=1 FL=1
MWAQRQVIRHSVHCEKDDYQPNCHSKQAEFIWQKTLGNSPFGHFRIMEIWGLQTFYFFKITTKILGIPSPKGDIDGSQVGHVFYVEKDIDRIVTYCEKDTIAVAQIFLRLRREDLLIDEEIIHV